MSSYQEPIAQRAAQFSPQFAANFANSDMPFPLVPAKNGYQLTRPQNNYCFNTTNYNVAYTNSNPSTTVLSSGGNVDIRVLEKSFAVSDDWVLHLNITNNTGAATTLVPARYLFNQIQLMANGGGTVLQILDQDILPIFSNLYNRSEWASLSQLENQTATWGGPTAIANGATVDYYIDMRGTLFQAIKLALLYPKGDFIIRLLFNPFSITNAAAGTAPTLNYCEAIFNTVRLDQRDWIDKQKKFSVSGGLNLGYFQPTAYKYTSQTFNLSSTYTIKLQGILGNISHLYFFMRTASATGTGLYTYTSLDGCTFDLLNSSGNSIITYTGNGRWLRLHESIEQFPLSEYYLNNNTYVLSLSSDANSAIQNGSLFGYTVSDGNLQFKLTTPSTFTNGTYDLIFFGMIYQQMTISQDGVVSTTSIS